MNLRETEDNYLKSSDKEQKTEEMRKKRNRDYHDLRKTEVNLRKISYRRKKKYKFWR